MAAREVETVAVALPDPSAPLGLLHPDRVRGSRVDRHQDMVARVCAVTRRIVHEEGVAEFSIHRLCDETSLSRQTIHNNLGKREEVLNRALNEFTTQMVQTSSQILPDIEGILFCMDGYTACLKQARTYITECVDYAFSQRSGSLQDLCWHGSHKLQHWIERMQMRGDIRTDIDPADLARHLVMVNTVTIYECNMMDRGLEELERQMRFRIVNTLRGSATSLGNFKIDTYLENASPLLWNHT